MSASNVAALYQLIVASTARFDDEIEELKREGVHATFNFYEEAGDGFAQHVHERYGDSLKE